MKILMYLMYLVGAGSLSLYGSSSPTYDAALRRQFINGLKQVEKHLQVTQQLTAQLKSSLLELNNLLDSVKRANLYEVLNYQQALADDTLVKQLISKLGGVKGAEVSQVISKLVDLHKKIEEIGEQEVTFSSE